MKGTEKDERIIEYNKMLSELWTNNAVRSMIPTKAEIFTVDDDEQKSKKPGQLIIHFSSKSEERSYKAIAGILKEIKVKKAIKCGKLH